MTWFKVDDGLHSHDKARAAGPAAMGLWAMAGSWSADKGRDGFVPEWFVQTIDPGRPTVGRKLAASLVSARLWTAAEQQGVRGWQFHQWDEYQPSGEAEKARKRSDSARQKVARSPQLRGDIRDRDKGLCRFCGIVVHWNDRRGPAGGTYDHVKPDGPTDARNLVIACRACNGRKGHRTPAQAGMVLLPAGTAADLSRDLGPGSESDLDTRGVIPNVLLVGSGQDGTERVRSGQDGPTRAAPGRAVADADPQGWSPIELPDDEPGEVDS